MRQLLLMRHAEAQAAHSEAADFARPLSPHGRQQARDVAQRLLAAALQPTLLLISPSARTRETAAILLEALAPLPIVQPEQEIYLGAPAALLAVLRRCADSAHSVMMIGHNPGLSALARDLMSAAPDGAASRERSWQLATAGLCQLRLDAAPWAQLAAEHVRSVSL